jgi:hypothetical protein
VERCSLDTAKHTTEQGELERRERASIESRENGEAQQQLS